MINYWLAVDDIIHDDIVSYIESPENYTGTIPAEHIEKFIVGVIDFKTVIGLYKPFNSKHLYTVYTSDTEVFNMLLAAYPTTDVLCSWEMDGTRLSDIHADTIHYMRDIFVEDDPDTGAGHYVPAVEITDSNLCAGQSPRNFS